MDCPVYVESEAEYLYEYGFLTKQGEKYLCNILLDEPTDELVRIHDEMYTKAAKLYANALYDAISSACFLVICFDPPKAFARFFQRS